MPSDPTRRVAAAKAAGDTAENDLAEAINIARSEGATWEQIGHALGYEGPNVRISARNAARRLSERRAHGVLPVHVDDETDAYTFGRVGMDTLDIAAAVGM